jgi:hypothetical protein
MKLGWGSNNDEYIVTMVMEERNERQGSYLLLLGGKVILDNTKSLLAACMRFGFLHSYSIISLAMDEMPNFYTKSQSAGINRKQKIGKREKKRKKKKLKNKSLNPYPFKGRRSKKRTQCNISYSASSVTKIPKSEVILTESLPTPK